MLRRTFVACIAALMLLSTMGAAGSCEAVGPENAGRKPYEGDGILPKNAPRPYPLKDNKKNETDPKVDNTNKGESLTYRAKWTGNGRQHKPYIIYSVYGNYVSPQNVKIEWGSWEKTLTHWGPPVGMQITQEDQGVAYQMECWILQGTRVVGHNKTDKRYSERTIRCSVTYVGDLANAG